jgi:hypothetical protein
MERQKNHAVKEIVLLTSQANSLAISLASSQAHSQAHSQLQQLTSSLPSRQEMNLTIPLLLQIVHSL